MTREKSAHAPKSMTVAEACRCFGVSRKTGSMWLERYSTGGIASLEERSRAPSPLRGVATAQSSASAWSSASAPKVRQQPLEVPTSIVSWKSLRERLDTPFHVRRRFVARHAGELGNLPGQLLEFELDRRIQAQGVESRSAISRSAEFQT